MAFPAAHGARFPRRLRTPRPRLVPGRRRDRSARLLSPPVVQEGFRWRNDDGSETTATWLASQDVDAAADLGVAVRLRVLLDATADPNPEITPTLYYKETADSTWLPVPVGASGAGGKWINHVAIAMPREGDTVHDVNPASSGTVVAGAYFTPTAGRFLLLVIDASVTSTAPGWTLEASQVSNTGLYCYTKTAAGADTVTSTHNAADYPAMFHWFEFAAGTTWVGDISDDIVDTEANPNLTGLTGTNLVMAAKATGVSNTAVRTGTWDGSNIEILDHCVVDADPGTDGYWLGIAYQEGYTGSSYQPTCVVTNTAAPCEAITWAINVAADNPVYIATSTNITAGGQATTAQLTAPSGKTTSDFVTGRMWDDENGSDQVTL